MSIVLWVLQVLAALLYLASGFMKVFMFDRISVQVASFQALPRNAWRTMGLLELACALGLVVPVVFHWQPLLTAVAAMLLAIESLVFVWVHVTYREVASTIFSAVLGLLMAFLAYGRWILRPVF